MSAAALGSTLCPLGLLLPVSLVLLVFECHLHIIDELGHTEKPKETKSARGPSTQSCRLAMTTPWASLRAALARGWGQSCHTQDTESGTCIVRGPVVPQADPARAGGERGRKARPGVAPGSPGSAGYCLHPPR